MWTIHVYGDLFEHDAFHFKHYSLQKQMFSLAYVVVGFWKGFIWIIHYECYALYNKHIWSRYVTLCSHIHVYLGGLTSIEMYFAPCYANRLKPLLQFMIKPLTQNATHFSALLFPHILHWFLIIMMIAYRHVKRPRKDRGTDGWRTPTWFGEIIHRSVGLVRSSHFFMPLFLDWYTVWKAVAR